MFRRGNIQNNLLKTACVPGESVSGTVGQAMKIPSKGRELRMSLIGEQATIGHDGGRGDRGRNTTVACGDAMPSGR